MINREIKDELMKQEEYSYVHDDEKMRMVFINFAGL